MALTGNDKPEIKPEIANLKHYDKEEIGKVMKKGVVQISS